MQVAGRDATLGVAHNASQDEIKKTYWRPARKYHLDICKEPDAGKRMAAINAARAEARKPKCKRTTENPPGRPCRLNGG